MAGSRTRAVNGAHKGAAAAFIRHNPSALPIIQAAQIALCTLAKVKSKTWAEMLERTARGEIQPANIVRLTREQQTLLEQHAHVLPHLRIAPVVTIYACDTCGAFGLAAKGTVPAKCAFTHGCSGAVTKASPTQYREPRKKKDADVVAAA